MAELRVDALTAGYGGPPIVQQVTVFTSAGERSVILGANGAGKSTLVKAIVGLVKVHSGQVSLDGRDLTGLKPHELVGHGVGYLPQLRNVFTELTVLENLRMGGRLYKGNLPDRIAALLELFPDLALGRHKKAGQLSGGQQRMLALARVLVSEPRILILDEPTAGLSPFYAELVWERCTAISATGMGLLVIEQNIAAAADWADRAFVLANGKVVAQGVPSELGGAHALASRLVG